MYKFSNRSLNNLEGVNPKLVELLTRVLERGKVDFTVIDGYRSAAKQNALYQKGRTKPGAKVTWLDGYNKKSYHQSGNAIDFIPAGYKFKSSNWDHPDDIAKFDEIGTELKKVATELGYNHEWGGDWKKRDRPHFQLNS